MTGVADEEPVSARSGELGLGEAAAGADVEGASLGVALASGASVDGDGDGVPSVGVGGGVPASSHTGAFLVSSREKLSPSPP